MSGRLNLRDHRRITILSSCVNQGAFIIQSTSDIRGADRRGLMGPQIELEVILMRTSNRLLTLTLVAGDHVTDLLKDVCQAGSARDFCVFLSGGQSPCAHRPRRLQRRELRQEHVWKTRHGHRGEVVA